MSNIYITDETRKHLVKAASIDCRTLDGEVNHLCKERLKQLNVIPDVNPSLRSEDVNSKQSEASSQGKIPNGQSKEAN